MSKGFQWLLQGHLFINLLFFILLKVRDKLLIPANATEESENEMVKEVVTNITQLIVNVIDTNNTLKIAQDVALYADMLLSLVRNTFF